MGLYKRGGVWWVKLQRDGVVIRRSSRSPVKAKAREYETHIRSEIDRQYRGGKPRHTFDQLMNHFWENHLPNLKPKAALRYVTSLRALSKHFSGKYVDEIDRPAIGRFVTARRGEGVSTATVRRDLACGSIAFSVGYNVDLADRNPFRDFSKKSLPEATPRTRVLTPAERTAVLAKAERTRHVIKAALLTGMRCGELCALKRADVDFDRGEVLVRSETSKNKRPRIVPLDGEGLAHFRAQKLQPMVPWMFWWGPGKPFTVEQVSRAFRSAARAAKVKDATFHDTRHSFASDRISRGMELFTLGKILGHSTPAQTAKYAHLATGAMKDAMMRTQAPAGTKPATGATENSDAE